MPSQMTFLLKSTFPKSFRLTFVCDHFTLQLTPTLNKVFYPLHWGVGAVVQLNVPHCHHPHVGGCWSRCDLCVNPIVLDEDNPVLGIVVITNK